MMGNRSREGEREKEKGGRERRERELGGLVPPSENPRSASGLKIQK